MIGIGGSILHAVLLNFFLLCHKKTKVRTVLLIKNSPLG